MTEVWEMNATIQPKTTEKVESSEKRSPLMILRAFFLFILFTFYLQSLCKWLSTKFLIFDPVCFAYMQMNSYFKRAKDHFKCYQSSARVLMSSRCLNASVILNAMIWLYTLQLQEEHRSLQSQHAQGLTYRKSLRLQHRLSRCISLPAAAAVVLREQDCYQYHEAQTLRAH